MIHASKRVQVFVEEETLESHIEQVLCALNDAWGSGNERIRSGYRRRALVVLIKLIQQMEAVAGNIGSLLARIQRGDFRAAEEIGTPELLKIHGRLSRFLSRFGASPRMQLQPALGSGVRPGTVYWQLSWVPLGGEGRFWYEVPLLLEIVQVARSGSINALRQCDQCQRWMFARRPAIDRFCKSECRDLFHRTNESDKTRRRDWARENYQTRKELEIGSRKTASRKGRKR
jgi:hypothetical protein